MKFDRRSIFLVDGVGALLSATGVGWLLPAWAEYLGVPVPTLRWLGAVAAAFAIYSLSCFWLADHNRPGFLMAIALANTLYCAVTLYVVLLQPDASPTWLARAYFLGEAAIVLTLVSIEWRIVGQVRRSLRETPPGS